MKTSTVVIIFALILGVHGLVLWLVLRDTGSTPEEPERAVGTEAAAQERQAAPAHTAPAVPSREEKMRRARAQIIRPYDYSSAVIGSIPGFRKGRPGTAGIIVDLNTRKVLWCKNAEKAFPIASMTKLMTVLVAYEMTQDPRSGVTLDTQVKVTVAAYKVGGSQVWLDPKESFTLRELMMAASIQSANDAAYLIAEFLGNGDVNLFVRKMNAKAAELGMKHTIFRNPHGLPGKKAAEDNVSSPEDMVRLAEATLLHPQLMEWASTWKAPFRKPGTKGYLEMRNHNHLIPGGNMRSPGVDGLKTGFINRSGYCLAVSCLRGDRRVVGIVMGHPTWKERDQFVISLLDWGYARIAKLETAAGSN